MERSCDGREDSSRLCYAIPEVRRERIDILLELHRKGADVFVLDFCRQPPLLWYHPVLADAYLKEAATNPREIQSFDIRDYIDWFQSRTEFLTMFMRELRREMRAQEDEIGRPCCLVVRIPDSSPMLMVAAGIDIEAWLRGNLVDATMLSPLVWSEVNPGSHPEYHVNLCHRYGKACIGGIGSLSLARGTGLESGAQAPPWKMSLPSWSGHSIISPLAKLEGSRFSNMLLLVIGHTSTHFRRAWTGTLPRLEDFVSDRQEICGCDQWCSVVECPSFWAA